VKLLSAGTPETLDWVVDENGQPLARVDRDAEKLVIYSRPNGKGRLRPIRTYSVEPREPSPIILYGRSSTAPMGSTEVVAGLLEEDGSRRLIRFDLSSGEELDVITGENGIQLTRAAYDPNTARADKGFVSRESDVFFYFDPRIERIRSTLDKAVNANSFGIYSASKDQNLFLVKATHSDIPAEFLLYNDRKKTLDYFSSTRPKLVEDVIDRRAFNYDSPDGLRIEGYLTTPQGKWGQPLPLVALPHGGPIGRDTLDYDWWAAFYAANGYAVYQPNFRGSTGYGKAFEEAGYGEWGAKMQDDITNGVTELIKSGHADGDRVCIVGASYGGYAALAGATMTPDLYTCAVSVNGVSDLPALIGHAQRENGEYAADYWEKRIGSRFKDAELLAAISPVNIADRAGPPIQLIHGEDDTVVPTYQSEKMAKALEASGKAFEFIKLEGEDHWLSGGETRTSMLRESLRFIEAHIGE
ncbi:MAG: S9 family peptidase, partial [Pseudomonadota bacterium]